ncbi:transcription termination factor Rho [Lachnospiraceae bacterium ZAX-1]
MREKYESLSVITLRDIAKARGLKHLSGLKKSRLVELMLEEDERDERSTIRSENKDLGKLDRANASSEKSKVKEERNEVKEDRNEVKEDRNEVKEDRNEVKEDRNEVKENRNEVKENRNEVKEHRKEAKENRNEVKEDGKEAKENRNEIKENRNEVKEDGKEAKENRSELREDRNEAKEDRKNGKIVTREGIEIENPELDSGVSANGILEVMPDGYGFIRCANYLPGENDVYVSPSQIRRFNLKTGDVISGNTRVKTMQEKFSALLYIKTINGLNPREAACRRNFEDMTPIFPNERIRLETHRSGTAMRIMDLVSPIGKGQRGMIVSQPKAGKTTLLKEVAKSITKNHPDMHLIILLIDERPEEVTDIKEAIEGKNVEVIYSTFDELPEHHKRVSEMVVERARRLVEHKKDVIILLDSITRLARAYNLIVPPSGRTLSGGIDPAALHMPKRFFGAARNMREGGSITILATALVDTGSRMDDVIYEEFKGTGNMELILDRKLSEKRVFPAIDITKSGTRREDLLLDKEEQEAVEIMRRAINGMRTDDAVENILNMFIRTNSNREFVQMIKKTKVV